jgi:hypothetical protein
MTFNELNRVENYIMKWERDYLLLRQEKWQV